MTSEILTEVTSEETLISPTIPGEIITSSKEDLDTLEDSKTKTLEKDSCQYCCCHFPTFVGFAVKSKDVSIPDDKYKPYFELETEEEKLSYEYFKLLARVTYDEVIEKHREQAMEELHQYRLSLLLEDLRLIEETDILYSSSDECYSELEIRIPDKRRSLTVKNKRRLFQKQKLRK